MTGRMFGQVLSRRTQQYFAQRAPMVVTEYTQIDLFLPHLIQQSCAGAMCAEQESAYFVPAATPHALACPQDFFGVNLQIRHIGIERGGVRQFYDVDQ